MIKVGNNNVADLKVSINKWDDGGDTTYFTIISGKQETWNRTDDRGFVMSVKKNDNVKAYYVLSGRDIVVSNNNVTRNGTVIEPLK